MNLKRNPSKKKIDRKMYRRPILVSYGSLRNLTTGGSGNAAEGGNPDTSKWRP